MTQRRWSPLEIALLVGGMACLGYYAYSLADMRLHQAAYSRQLDSLIAARASEAARRTLVPPAGAVAPAIPSTAVRLEGDLVGRIEIPRVGVNAAVVYGDTPAILRIAVGQLLGTPRPGRTGNIALAGHRDTFFANLKGIRLGDRITIRLPDGDYEYEVTGTSIVKPEDTSVLSSTDGSVLTLITCYPFRYVGPAPLRFIVRATLRVE